MLDVVSYIFFFLGLGQDIVCDAARELVDSIGAHDPLTSSQYLALFQVSLTVDFHSFYFSQTLACISVGSFWYKFCSMMFLMFV